MSKDKKPVLLENREVSKLLAKRDKELAEARNALAKAAREERKVPLTNSKKRYAMREEAFLKICDNLEALKADKRFSCKMDIALILGDLGNWWTADLLTPKEEVEQYEHLLKM